MKYGPKFICGAWKLHLADSMFMYVDLPCSGPVTRSGEILTTDKSHGYPGWWNTILQLAEGIMADLWRDFWIRETGTGQQLAQLHMTDIWLWWW